MKFELMIAGLAFFAALAALGTPPSKNIHEDVDPYNGRKTLFLEVSTHTCPGDPPRGVHDPEVHLLFTALQRPDHGVSYYVTPELDRGYTLNLGHKGTMDTLIDGVPGVFDTTLGSTVVTAYDNTSRSYSHETIPFAVERKQIEALSLAATFQFRVNGTRQNVQRCADAKHLRDLPEFLEVASHY